MFLIYHVTSRDNLASFGGHRHCGSTDIADLIFHVIL